jgi:hypothetical protein
MTRLSTRSTNVITGTSMHLLKSEWDHSGSSAISDFSLTGIRNTGKYVGIYLHWKNLLVLVPFLFHVPRI